MTSKTKFRPSPALVISCLALFLALTGSALAAKASIGSNQIVNGSVRTVDLRDSAVSSPKVADATITADDLGTDSVGTDEIARRVKSRDRKDAVKSDEIAENAVTSSEVAPGLADRRRPRVQLGHLPGDRRPDDQQQRHRPQRGRLRASSASWSSGPTRTSLAAGRTAASRSPARQDEQIISGGGAPSAYGVEMTSNAPSGNGWFYAASNKTAATQTITVYALCLS